MELRDDSEKNEEETKKERNENSRDYHFLCKEVDPNVKKAYVDIIQSYSSCSSRIVHFISPDHLLSLRNLKEWKIISLKFIKICLIEWSIYSPIISYYYNKSILLLIILSIILPFPLKNPILNEKKGIFTGNLDDSLFIFIFQSGHQFNPIQSPSPLLKQSSPLFIIIKFTVPPIWSQFNHLLIPQENVQENIQKWSVW